MQVEGEKKRHKYTDNANRDDRVWSLHIVLIRLSNAKSDRLSNASFLWQSAVYMAFILCVHQNSAWYVCSIRQSGWLHSTFLYHVFGFIDAFLLYAFALLICWHCLCLVFVVTTNWIQLDAITAFHLIGVQERSVLLLCRFCRFDTSFLFFLRTYKNTYKMMLQSTEWLGLTFAFMICCSNLMHKTALAHTKRMQHYDVWADWAGKFHLRDTKR